MNIAIYTVILKYIIIFLDILEFENVWHSETEMGGSLEQIYIFTPTVVA
jgi:hypothetical protein